jgi:hypothetical protein
MEFALVNPHKRGGKKRRARRSAAARKSSRRSVSVARHVSRSRRRSYRGRARNPISLGGLKNRLMPAVVGGAGAVATDLAYRFLPVPGALSILKGTLAPVTKVGVAFAVAKLASMIVGGKRADEMLTGSLAVIAYGLVSDGLLRFLPVIGAPAAAPAAVSGAYDFAGLGYTGPAATLAPGGGVGEYVSGMGEYIGGGEYDFAGN